MAGNDLGKWSFALGVIIAVVAGTLSPSGQSPMMVSLLIILGLVVGFLNVTAKEANKFLIAAVSLVLVSHFGGAVLNNVALIGPYLAAVLVAILTYVVPATIVVAVKAIASLARE